VKVGDVILAPAVVEPPEPESWRPGLRSSWKPRREPATSRWYGEPILIGDGTAYTCLLLAAAFDMKETYQAFVPPALLGYALVGPITHLAHGNWGRTGLSLLTRGVLPIVGLVIGAQGCQSGSGDCFEGLVALGAVGMVAASALDIAVIAREPLPSKPRGWLTPALSLSRDHALLGAAGGF
jgi:hypothetical protein